jgi:hypothetical protein
MGTGKDPADPDSTFTLTSQLEFPAPCSLFLVVRGEGEFSPYVGFCPVSVFAMMRRWICPVPSKMS